MALFTSQSAAAFYDKLFGALEFTLPRAATGRRGFPKEAMLCAFLVMKCEGFGYITDLMDYLENNRIIAHYCGFDIMRPLPSYWTYDRFLRQLNNGELKTIMAGLVRQLYKLGVVDASFIGLDSTPVMANTRQNNPKSFAADKFDLKNHVKDVYEGEAVIPLNNRSTKKPKKLAVGNPICEAGLAMSKDGKTPDGHGGLRQKFCCPFRQSKTTVCPCNHKNWNNGKKNRGCTKYKAIPSDYRRSIDRECLRFKRTYALRTECERYNSRFKETGQERLWVRNGRSVAYLNTLAHISALAVAYAAVLNKSSHSYRSKKALRRSA